MENRKKAFFSNQLGNLLSSLKKELFLNKKFSVKRIVVVPSKQIKNWIEEAIATDENFKVCSFIKFIDSAQINSIINFFGIEKKFPTNFELNLLIENEIKKLVSPFPIEKEIVDYLEMDGKFSQKTKRRLKLLADELADLFLLYGIFGKNLDFNNNSWQMRLWRQIFERNWTYPLKALDEITLQSDVEIHFFALNFLPKVFCEFLEKLDFCNLYFLSPCMYFWEDVCSKREKKALRKVISKKISISQIEEIEKYLEDSNPFLANFGKIQKEFLKNINFEAFEVFEDYSVGNSDWLENNKFDVSLLSAVKEDFLHLRNPQEKYSINNDVSSIEIHEAPNKKREIEILHDFILKELSFVKPLDILVLCPNIKEYEPYIHLVFANSVLYKISNVEIAAKSFFAAGMIDLLFLVESSFDLHDMIKLFSNPSFLKKHELTNEDFLSLKKWIQNANIVGNSLNTLEDYKNWEKGLERILKGFIFGDENINQNFSDLALFDKFLNVFFELKNDIQIIENQKAFTLQEWQKILKEIALKNFSTEKDEIELAASQIFEKFLEDLMKMSKYLEDKVDFETIYLELKQAFSKTSNIGSSQCNAISFQNFNSFSPAKIICAIGMNDDFPKPNVVNSLDLLKEKYVPSQYDEKRYIFLQSLLLSEKKLYLSYIGLSLEDGKKQEASSFILELLSYIKESYEIDSEKIIKSHPAVGFDKIYFSSEFTFSALNEKAAKKYYFGSDEPRMVLSDMYNNIKLTEISLPNFVNLDDLRSLARNPLKFYYNQVLGIYLEKEQEEIEIKDFVFNKLDKFLFFKEILKRRVFDSKNFEKNKIMELLFELEMDGKLPVGIMKQVAIDEVILEANNFYGNFKNLNLQNTDFFDVEFKESNSQIFKHNDKLNMPPIEVLIDGKPIKIIGKLQDVSTRGLFSQSDDSFFSIIKLWPEYLIFLKIQKKLDLEKNILFLKSGIEKKFSDFDVDMTLQKYLKYYAICLSHPSPLVKDWAEALLLKNENMEKTIIKSLEKEEYVDPYFKAATFSFDIPPSDIIINNWSLLLKNTFTPLLDEI